MEYLKVSLALLVTMQWTSQAVADMNIIQERFVNTTNIIRRIPFTTITSCFMKCSAHKKCSAIGFGVDPALKTNSECLLLLKVEDYGIEEREGLVSVFVMIKNEEEFVTTKPVLPDCPVDGGFSDWSAYTTCSTSCDAGVQTRSRDCNNPFMRGAGANCSKLGNPTEQRTCNLTPCAIDGGYSDWSAFTTCSTSCDAGVQTRSRDCNNPFPRGAGAHCSKLGSPTEQRTCNLKPCPIQGGWGSFGSWSSCGASCGSSGTKTRFRLCNSPAPQHGGSCTGGSSEASSCVTQCASAVNFPSSVSGSTNGQPYIQGHVEVLYSGVWGTICDDYVQSDVTNGNNVANVLCRMRGYKSGVYSNDYRQSSASKSSKIWLRLVKCNGNEGNIGQCTLAAGWNGNGCTHGEDIGIRCYL